MIRRTLERIRNALASLAHRLAAPRPTETVPSIPATAGPTGNTTRPGWLPSGWLVLVTAPGHLSRGLAESLGATKLLHGFFYPLANMFTNSEETLIACVPFFPDIVGLSRWLVAQGEPCAMILDPKDAVRCSKKPHEIIGRARWQTSCPNAPRTCIWGNHDGVPTRPHVYMHVPELTPTPETLTPGAEQAIDRLAETLGMDHPDLQRARALAFDAGMSPNSPRMAVALSDILLRSRKEGFLDGLETGRLDIQDRLAAGLPARDDGASTDDRPRQRAYAVHVQTVMSGILDGLAQSTQEHGSDQRPVAPQSPNSPSALAQATRVTASHLRLASVHICDGEYDTAQRIIENEASGLDARCNRLDMDRETLNPQTAAHDFRNDRNLFSQLAGAFKAEKRVDVNAQPAWSPAPESRQDMEHPATLALRDAERTRDKAARLLAETEVDKHPAYVALKAAFDDLAREANEDAERAREQAYVTGWDEGRASGLANRIADEPTRLSIVQAIVAILDSISTEYDDALDKPIPIDNALHFLDADLRRVADKWLAILDGEDAGAYNEATL